MSNINDFKDLRIWQNGMEIAEKCYFITKLFPKDELYGMVQQIRRSAVSIPANIAEGYGRRTRGEYLRFLNIAQGSINELETHLILSKRLKLCPEKEVEMILTLLKQESKMIIRPLAKIKIKCFLVYFSSKSIPPFPVPRSPFPTSARSLLV